VKKLPGDIEIGMMRKYKTGISIYDNTFLNKAVQVRFSELPVTSNKEYLHILENVPNELLIFSISGR
jgi:hypothetical protein